MNFLYYFSKGSCWANIPVQPVMKDRPIRGILKQKRAHPVDRYRRMKKNTCVPSNKNWKGIRTLNFGN
jgi:hypothetical protein